MWNKVKSHPVFIGAVLTVLWKVLTPESLARLAGLVWAVVSPLGASLALAFILNIPLVFFEGVITGHIIRNPQTKRVLSGIRALSIALSAVCLFGALALLIVYTLPQVIASASGISDNWEGITGWISSAGRAIEKALPWLTGAFSGRDLLGEANAWLVRLVSGAGVDDAVSLAGGLFSAFTGGIVALFLSMYILFNKERFALHCKRLLFAMMREDDAQYALRICRLSALRFNGFAKGQFSEGVTFAVMLFGVLKLFGFPYALLISVVSFAASFVPVFGSIAALAFGALITAVNAPSMLVAFTCVYLAAEQIDVNVIYPRLVGRHVGLNGFWVVFAVSAGGAVAGPVGMLLAVPLTSVVYAVVIDTVDFSLRRKGITPESYL